MGGGHFGTSQALGCFGLLTPSQCSVRLQLSLGKHWVPILEGQPAPQLPVRHSPRVPTHSRVLMAGFILRCWLIHRPGFYPPQPALPVLPRADPPLPKGSPFRADRHRHTPTVPRRSSPAAGPSAGLEEGVVTHSPAGRRLSPLPSAQSSKAGDARLDLGARGPHPGGTT